MREHSDIMSTPSPTYERKSADGSSVKLTWFNDGADAVVHILRDKSAVTFRMSRQEAEALRALLPAQKPDEERAK